MFSATRAAQDSSAVADLRAFDLRFEAAELLRDAGCFRCPRDFSAVDSQSQRTVVEQMPKQKTHKGMKKRFKVTASGKATKRSAFRGHILSKKNGKRKRHLRHNSIVVGADARHIVEGLRPCS